MNPITIAKLAVDLVVSAGVGAVVGNAVKASTPNNLKLVQKISIAVGGYVLSGMIGNMAVNSVSEQIDTVTFQVKELKNNFNKTSN